MVGSVVSGIFGAVGAKMGADVQVDAAREAAATQRYMYDTTRADFAPYRMAGGLALSRLANTYGLGGYGDLGTFNNLSAMGGGAAPAGAPGAPGGGTAGAPTPQAPGGALAQSVPLTPAAYGIGDEGGVTMSQILGSGFQPAGVNNSGALLVSPQQVAGAGGANTLPGGAGGDTLDPGQSLADTAQQRQASAWDAFLSSPEYRVSQEFTGPEMYRSLGATQAAGGRTALDPSGQVANTGALRETARYGHGLGLSTYGDYANRLSSLAGIGQAETRALGQIGQSAASNISSAQLQAGAAQGSGYVGMANALGGPIGAGINQAMGGFGSYGGYGGLNAPQVQSLQNTARYDFNAYPGIF